MGDLRFADVSAEWGLDHEGVSFGCVLADLAGDGNLDLIFSNYDAPPTIIRNHTTGAHRVEIKLAGRVPNRDGIGAELRLGPVRVEVVGGQEPLPLRLRRLGRPGRRVESSRPRQP